MISDRGNGGQIKGKRSYEKTQLRLLRDELSSQKQLTIPSPLAQLGYHIILSTRIITIGAGARAGHRDEAPTATRMHQPRRKTPEEMQREFEEERQKMRRANGLSSSSSTNVVDVAGARSGTFDAESNDVLASLMKESKESQQKHIQRLEQATQQQPEPVVAPGCPELSFDGDFFGFDSDDNHFFSLPGSNRGTTAQSRLGNLIGVDLDSPTKSKFSSSSSSLLLDEGLGRDIFGGSYLSPTLKMDEFMSVTSNLGIPSPPSDCQIQTLLGGLNIGEIHYDGKSEVSNRQALRTQQETATQSVFSKLGIQPNSPVRAQLGGRSSSSPSQPLEVLTPNRDSGTFLNDLRGKTKVNSTFVFSGSDPSTPSASRTSTLQVSSSAKKPSSHAMSASTKLKLMSMQQKKKTAGANNEIASPDNSMANLATSNGTIQISQDSSRKPDKESDSPSIVKRLDVSLLFGSPKKL